MSMCATVGLNTRLPSAGMTRMLVSGARGFHAAYIKGTVNEPTEYPQPNATHGSYHWIFERLISASLVPMVAVATVKHGACGTLDAVLSATLLMHSHIGFDALLVDYLDKRKFPVTGPVAKWILRAATVATAVGLYGTYLMAFADPTEFNTSTCGWLKMGTRFALPVYDDVVRLLAPYTVLDPGAIAGGTRTDLTRLGCASVFIMATLPKPDESPQGRVSVVLGSQWGDEGKGVYMRY
ncbi:membrane anchor subunit of succinate dehydrogenase, Sdh4 [Malassezia equina]|uniref:Succinate dehydrogenase [ubiquinone] cytochrome b small subunit n=1 Tax=Malassezia equina TaxID=1381935 RepID=A0AAF0EBQ4_9BASI|nr:membrane anchor subunit of succinate dehydrogenase, Sdh4 [Malassezia equina]